MTSTATDFFLSKSFFNDLWPLILYDNICDTRQKNTGDYFVPEQRFDELWAHSLLASIPFKNYNQPIELRYERADEETSVENKQVEANIKQTRNEVEVTNAIITLEQQIKTLQQQQQQRAKLSYDYANRTHPWYIEKSIYAREFHLDDSIELHDGFQLKILRDIEVHQCRLMIIDMPCLMQLRQMEHWLKFQRYVLIIVVTRCAFMARQLRLLGDDVKSLLLLENSEISNWQLALTQSLHAAISYAKASKYYENCAKPFVYVFARQRLASDINTYKILQQT